MGLPHYTQLRKIGKYPDEKFSYLFLDESNRAVFPIQLYFAGNAVWCEGVECVRKNSPFASIEWIQEGCFQFSQEHRTVDVCAGELILLHPEVETRLVCKSRIGRKYVVALCGAMLPEVLATMGLQQTIHAVPRNPDRWEELVGEADRLLQNPVDFSECALFAYRLLLEFRSLNDLQGYPLALQLLLRYIARNLLNAPQLVDLVRESGVSQAGVYRLFRRYLQISPVDYIREMRLKRGVELLRVTDCSIKEIADLLGYSSPQYFAGEFRKKYAFSPTDYRRKIKTLEHTPF